MNEEQMKGQWTQVKGKAKQYWAKLTDDDLKRIDGQRQELTGRIVERYGIAKEKAEEQVQKFLKDYEEPRRH